MPTYFTDISADISFELITNLKKVPLKKGKNSSFNIGLLQLYGIYRNAVYDSYKTKKDLAEDIQTRKKVFTEAATSKANQDAYYHEPLYHYAVMASQDAMKEWNDSNGQMKMFVAYRTANNKKVKIGFVHFIEKMMNNKPVVYIAQAGVSPQGNHIGRGLMECVLAQYPANTEFYILTRIFNTNAKILYQERLKFVPIEHAEVQVLGYDKRYCGFKHTTSSEELNLIKKKMKAVPTIAPVATTAPPTVFASVGAVAAVNAAGAAATAAAAAFTPYQQLAANVNIPASAANKSDGASKISMVNVKSNH